MYNVGESSEILSEHKAYPEPLYINKARRDAKLTLQKSNAFCPAPSSSLCGKMHLREVMEPCPMSVWLPCPPPFSCTQYVNRGTLAGRLGLFSLQSFPKIAEIECSGRTCVSRKQRKLSEFEQHFHYSGRKNSTHLYELFSKNSHFRNSPCTFKMSCIISMVKFMPVVNISMYLLTLFLFRTTLERWLQQGYWPLCSFNRFSPHYLKQDGWVSHFDLHLILHQALPTGLLLYKWTLI